MVRLWTIHPAYLDSKGLGGAWREVGMIAAGAHPDTPPSYATRHSHTARWRLEPWERARAALLTAGAHIFLEREARGLNSDPAVLYSRLYASREEWQEVVASARRANNGEPCGPDLRVGVSRGQIAYEAAWLEHKLTERASTHEARWRLPSLLREVPVLSPPFVCRKEPMETYSTSLCLGVWERAKPPALERLRRAGLVSLFGHKGPREPRTELMPLVTQSLSC